MYFIESRGAEVFSMIPGAPSAKQLGEVLEKSHGANNKRATLMIHPTVSSLLALSLGFLSDAVDWSPGSTVMNKMLHKLATMLKVYIYSDILKRANITPEAERICKEVSHIILYNREDIDILEITKELSTAVVHALREQLDEIDVAHRLNSIADRLDYMVRLYMVLGTVPLRIVSKEDIAPKLSLPHVYKTSGSLNGIVNELLDILEHGISRAFPPTLTEILTDCIITVRDETMTVTNSKGISYEQLSFDNGMHTTLLKTVIGNVRPPLCAIIPHELQYIYGHIEGKKHILEHLVRTKVLMSSKPTGAILDALIKARETPAKDLVNELRIKAMRENEHLQELKNKHHILTTAMREIGARTSSGDRVEIQKSLAQLKEQLKKNASIAQSISRLDQEATKYATEVANEPLFYTEPLSHVQGDIPFSAVLPNSKEAKSRQKYIYKTIQDGELAKRVKHLNELLNNSSVKIAAMTNETKSLFIENETLRRNNTDLENGMNILAAEAGLAERRAKEIETINEKLLEQLDHVKSVISNMTTALKLSDADRERLSHLITSSSASVGDLTSSANAVEQVHSLMNVFGSYGTNASKNEIEVNAHGRLAYDQVLSQHCVRPISTFPYVKTRRHLITVNEWLPESWMEDREVRDELSSNVIFEEKQDNSSGTTTDIFWLDVNPINEEREDKVNKALGKAGINPIDHIFERQYLNGQFKSRGDVAAAIEKPLGDMWERFVANFFKIGDESIHKVGVRIKPDLSLATQYRFIAPFIRLYMGINAPATDILEYVVHSARLTNSEVPDEDVLFRDRYDHVIAFQTRKIISRTISETIIKQHGKSE